METPTYEQIDAAFRSFDATKHQATVQRLSTPGVVAGAAPVLGQICPIYKVVRPFLQAAAGFPILPPAWKAGISAFIGAMDLLCP